MPSNEFVDCFVSVATHVRNQPEPLEVFVRRTHAILSAHFTDHEILVIDRQSDDESVAKFTMLLGEIPSIRYLHLTSDVHPDVAWLVACENAIGDFVVLVPVEDNPASVLIPAVELCRSGCDIVVGTSRRPTPWRVHLVQPLIAYLLRRIIDYSLPPGATQFRCISRRAVNSVVAKRGARHRFPFRLARTGYASSSIAYQSDNAQAPREGLRQTLRDAVRLVVFNSTAPIWIVGSVGIFGSFLSFLGALYSIIAHFFVHHIVEGWTTIVLLISGLFCILFLILATLGEYLARMLDETIEREYDVVYERSSSVMLRHDRRNVLSDSEAALRNEVQTGKER
jgi:hypothetical protein